VEALGLLNRRWYDLIVSDLKMPALNGPGLYREVLRRWPNHHPQVLFVSGFADTAAYAHFLNGVHVPVMCKPFKPEHLVETIRRMLDEHEAANRGCGRGELVPGTPFVLGQGDYHSAGAGNSEG